MQVLDQWKREQIARSTMKANTDNTDPINRIRKALCRSRRLKLRMTGPFPLRSLHLFFEGQYFLRQYSVKPLSNI